MRLFAAVVVGLVLVATLGRPLGGQSPARVDFARDVQPLLQTRCVGCHGPVQQQAGYRLDRRSGALGGVVRRNIVPGSGETSRLYRRVSGTLFGQQMPPTGALAPDEIAILKQWIDEGAEWPDALANEVELPAESVAASRLNESIRTSDATAVRGVLSENASIVNGRGRGGSTPVMYAALYGSVDLLTKMLDAGGDPNLRNHAGATALMWALDDIENVRMLLDRGADVNALSNFGRAPLQLAAAQNGSAPVVKLLLERGAIPTPAALTSAATAGNAEVIRLLLAAGARDTGSAAAAALRARCRDCFAAIVGVNPSPSMTGLLTAVLPPSGPGHADMLREAIDRGGNVNARDAKERTPLMAIAISDTVAPESVTLLTDRGADINAKNPDGRTPLFFAKRLGRTAVVDALEKAGAKSEPEVDPPLALAKNNTIRDAVQRSLPLLQRTATAFYEKSGCVSCHHNTLAAMTLAAVRPLGFAVDEASAREELTTIVRDIDVTRDQALQGIVAPGGLVTTTGYILMGLASQGHQADAATDALVRLLRRTQRADGGWATAYRPPQEASEMTAVAVSLRGVQLYGRGQDRAANQKVVDAARSWLEEATPRNTEERVFRLFGLTWAGAANDIRQSAVRDLLAIQRDDGGWAQLATLQSDAYATGSALVALHEAGVRPDDTAYRRGVQFLLATQVADGSWFVRTRTHPTQIYFESGFPHGEHQFISAAATNWATQALAYAVDRSR